MTGVQTCALPILFDRIRVRNHAIGINFIDVYFRTGLYPLQLPSGLGQEAAGVVEAVGKGVTHVAVGDRVAYAARPNGSYSEVRVMPADILLRLPDAIDFETAAAMMLQGMTVQYLLKRTYPVKAAWLCTRGCNRKQSSLGWASRRPIATGATCKPISIR